MSVDQTDEIERLHVHASEKTGLSDFGDASYREGLAALLQALDIDFESTQETRRAMRDSLADLLIGRLYCQEGWRQYPEVLNTQIRRPVIVVGFARTGTTALHKLLSCDPQFQYLEFWLAHRPMVRPPRETWVRQAEYVEMKLACEAMHLRDSSLINLHHWAAEDAEECKYAMLQTFSHWAWAIDMPSYANWIKTQDRRQSYYRYRNTLKLIGAADQDKRWLLKDPFHVMDLDLLLEVFPDAGIVQTHRDPLKAIPSWYSLHKALYPADQRPNRFDLVGRAMCEFWRVALERSSAVRERSRSLFFDVDQNALASHPLEVVRSIYDYFGLSLSEEAERRMSEWLSNRGPRTGTHRHDLDSFDVSAKEIRSMFREYRSSRAYSS